MRTSNTKKNRQKMVALLAAMLLFFVLGIIAGKIVNKSREETKLDVDVIENELNTGETQPDEQTETIIEEPDTEKKIAVRTIEGKKKVIYEPEGPGYRYSPSIMRNEDGSVDIWIVSPGNNSTQWDYIRYLHSNDRIDWSEEEIVLRPTKNSKDQCSVCDPGVIYFNDYYYLGYTSTSDYDRNGYDNSVFVARSKNPDGPFEKWNGNGWGGDPEPIIEYDGDPDGWGVGEVSFVIKDKVLYIYYTYNNNKVFALHTARADLTENWPETIRDKQIAIEEKGFDAAEIVYVEDIDMFMLFGITDSFTSGSRLEAMQSEDGLNFTDIDIIDCYIDEYSLGMGVEKDKNGHVRTGEELFIGYGFGYVWSQWTGRLRNIIITQE